MNRLTLVARGYSLALVLVTLILLVAAWLVGAGPLRLGLLVAAAGLAIAWVILFAFVTRLRRKQLADHNRKQAHRE